MKPEQKAALQVGGTTALLTAAVAATITNPVAWAAVVYGAYRMGKAAYERTKAKRTSCSSDHDLFI